MVSSSDAYEDEGISGAFPANYHPNQARADMLEKHAVGNILLQMSVFLYSIYLSFKIILFIYF